MSLGTAPLTPEAMIVQQTAELVEARLWLVLKIGAAIAGAVLLYSLFFASRRD